MKKIIDFILLVLVILPFVGCATTMQQKSDSLGESPYDVDGSVYATEQTGNSETTVNVEDHFENISVDESLDIREIYLYMSVEPTCESAGIEIYRYCDNDDFAFEKEVCSPLGHRARRTIGEIDYCRVCGKPVYGLAGGYIFYDVDADNEIGNMDGLNSQDCKWRYLEAVTDNVNNAIFGYYKKDFSGNNLFSNGKLSYSAVDCSLSGIGCGKDNTELLVRRMNNNVYGTFSNGIPVMTYAVKLAYDFECNGYDDWFLPSADELQMLYENIYRVNKDRLKINLYTNYWSSSEVESFWANSVYSLNFLSGQLMPSERFFEYGVIPVRRFLHGESEHVWEKKVIKSPTCVEQGILQLSCELCEKVVYERIPIDRSGHSVMSNGVCRLCGEMVENVTPSVNVDVTVVVNNHL